MADCPPDHPQPSHQIPLIPSGLINPCKILTMPQTLNLRQINQPKVGIMRGCKIPCFTSLGKTWPHRAGYHMLQQQQQLSSEVLGISQYL